MMVSRSFTTLILSSNHTRRRRPVSDRREVSGMTKGNGDRPRADRGKETGGMSDAKRRLGLYSFLSPSLHRYARHSSRPSVVSVPFLSAFGLESGSLHALRADCKERRGTRVTRAGRERTNLSLGSSSLRYARFVG